jgi:hypothetical protein
MILAREKEQAKQTPRTGVELLERALQRHENPLRLWIS